jgi:hypothetical protein
MATWLPKALMSFPAGAQHVMMLCALLDRLNLDTTYYLTNSQPVPSTLLVAAAICLQPFSHAYQLLTKLQRPLGHGTEPVTGSCTHLHNKLNSTDGVLEVMPTPNDKAAAAPAVELKQGASPKGFTLDCTFSSHLGALRTVKEQVEGKLKRLTGNTFQEDLKLAASTSCGSGRHLALVRYQTPAAVCLYGIQVTGANDDQPFAFAI